MTEKHTHFPSENNGVISPHTVHKMVWDAFMLACTSYARAPRRARPRAAADRAAPRRS